MKKFYILKNWLKIKFVLKIIFLILINEKFILSFNFKYKNLMILIFKYFKKKYLRSGGLKLKIIFPAKSLIVISKITFKIDTKVSASKPTVYMWWKYNIIIK